MPDSAVSNVRRLHPELEVSSERVTVVHVRVFEDVETIGSRYRTRRPVLFDVSACTREVARRTVDFVAGRVLDLCGVEHDLVRRWGDEA